MLYRWFFLNVLRNYYANVRINLKWDVFSSMMFFSIALPFVFFPWRYIRHVILKCLTVGEPFSKFRRLFLNSCWCMFHSGKARRTHAISEIVCQMLEYFQYQIEPLAARVITWALQYCRYGNTIPSNFSKQKPLEPCFTSQLTARKAVLDCFAILLCFTKLKFWSKVCWRKKFSQSKRTVNRKGAVLQMCPTALITKVQRELLQLESQPPHK